MFASNSRNASGGNSVAALIVEQLLLPHMAETTVDILRNMELFKEENSRALLEFSQTNICSAIVDVMKKHSRSTGMQWKCCDLLMSFAYKDDQYQFCQALLEAGAAAVITNAMEQFPENERIQHRGCGALLNLSSFKSSHESIVDAGGIAAVIRAMQQFPEQQVFKLSGCCFLRNLIDGSSITRDQVIQEGGVDAVLGAMKECVTDKLVQEHACSCLYNLAMNDEKARSMIAARGGDIILAETLHQFRGQDAALEEAARRLLEVLIKK